MKKQTILSLSAAVAMSLIVGASLVACGGKSTSTAAAASVTKTGTGKGFGGDIVATLTVESDGTVSDCKLEGASETESIGGAALEELAKQVVAANGAEIDGVSGATLTTNGVKDAVTAALVSCRFGHLLRQNHCKQKSDRLWSVRFLHFMLSQRLVTSCRVGEPSAKAAALSSTPRTMLFTSS